MTRTAASVERLRRVGVGRINFDLLYGLPLQTVDSCLDTVAKCVELRPDRFSVFGYAHVPSFKKHQHKIAEASLPNSIERHLQSETIAQALLDAGYVRIGLDHFALPGDSLAIARQDGRLKRNFQGYTDDSADTLIGLGASAIGRMPQGFVQNAVPTRDYLARIAEDRLATSKGYLFTGKIASAPTSSSGSCATSRSICPGIPVARPRPSIRAHRSAADREPHRRRRRDDDRSSAFDPRRRGIPGAEHRIGDAHLAHSAATHSRAV